jgi:hypothetical protein
LGVVADAGSCTVPTMVKRFDIMKQKDSKSKQVEEIIKMTIEFVNKTSDSRFRQLSNILED